MNRYALVLLSFFFLCGQIPSAHAQTAYLSSEENNFYVMVNQFRKKLNLPRVDIQLILESVAKAHSTWMAGQENLTHYGPTLNFTPFQRMELAGYKDYTYAGENIACGYSDALSTFKQWAGSPLHLQNMLNPHFHQLGIARAGTGNERCPYYWTSDYGSITDPDNDPAVVTDTVAIQQAIADVTGSPIANPGPGPAPVTPTPAPVMPPPTPTPLAGTAGTVSNLRCMIPYSLAKGTVSYFLNIDTLVEANRSASGEVAVTLSFYQNAQPANVPAVSLSSASLLANPDFPLVSLFAAPARQNGGFIIQLNTRTNQAQYSSYSTQPFQSGAVLCTIRFY